MCNTWEQRKLGEICEITMGQSPDGSTYSDEPSDYILVQGNADLKDGWVVPRIWTTQKTKTAQAGDLIISVRAPAGAMGKTAYDAVIGRGVAAIKGSEFIYQTLVKIGSEGYWKKLAAGSTFESINSDAVKGAEIFVPQDIEEQNKIGDYFSNLDHLITLHQRKYFIIYNKLITWEQRKLGEIATETYGGGTPKTSNEEFWKGDIPWIQSSDLIDECLFDVRPRKCISQESVSKSATKLVPQNSIAIVTRVGVGKLAFMPFSYATSQDFLSLSGLKIDPEFTVYALFKMMQSVSNEVQGTSIKGVTKDELLVKKIIFPSCDEQKKIGAYLHNLDNLITLHRRAL
ncbi:restriction endonuclease subunit S [Eubacterium ventriosum]|uniref:restriction endonuclease subunit S n=1 Tax=Eubacterium ventriosum TaxID=39496 RepID=UPI00241D11FB|nr:restriction endonuclease subunit S [Eubacterium ventriosum]